MAIPHEHEWVLIEAWQPEYGPYEFWQCAICFEQRDAEGDGRG
jgi:hypothetical protein